MNKSSKDISSLLRHFLSEKLFDPQTILHKDKSWPKISIVTPSLNQGRYIETCILSVLNQNYPNLEYIIIDGMSKDNTLDIIKKYNAYISYWVSEKDKGQADAINKGFKLASGDLLCFINSDDFLLPNSLFSVAIKFQKNPHIFFLISKVILVNDNYEIIFFDRGIIPNKFSLLLVGMTGFCQQGTFWRKNIRDEIGLLDDSYNFCFDYDYFCRIVKKFIPYKLNRYTAGFRIHPQSKTSRLIELKRREDDKVKIKNDDLKLNLMQRHILKKAYKIKAYYEYFKTILYTITGKEIKELKKDISLKVDKI